MVFTSLIESMVEDPKIIITSRRIKKSAENVQKISKFVQDDLDAEGGKIEWQDVNAMLRRAESSLDLSAMVVVSSVDGFDILADNMFKRAVSTIIENSLRHSEWASTITVNCLEGKDGLHLLIGDDEIGIPQDEKEVIFNRGHGKNTGFGLFYTREIMKLNGFTIQEKGGPGEGALFDITVPGNRYRRDGVFPVE